MITTHGRTHWSPETCYGCKLNSLTFDRGRPKTHARKGDPWEGNPVKERIEEIQRSGREYEGKKVNVAAFELKNPEAQHAHV